MFLQSTHSRVEIRIFAVLLKLLFEIPILFTQFDVVARPTNNNSSCNRYFNKDSNFVLRIFQFSLYSLQSEKAKNILFENTIPTLNLDVIYLYHCLHDYFDKDCNFILRILSFRFFFSPFSSLFIHVVAKRERRIPSNENPYLKRWYLLGYCFSRSEQHCPQTGLKTLYCRRITVC